MDFEHEAARRGRRNWMFKVSLTPTVGSLIEMVSKIKNRSRVDDRIYTSLGAMRRPFRNFECFKTVTQSTASQLFHYKDR